MTNFLDNTIYTNHALNKICNNLAGNYENFNFIKVKIGSGDSTLSQDRTDMSATLYTLRIGEVSYEDGVVTIICELPPELADVPITEIGLFDTVLGIDYLFSYSKVELTKPADLGYELTVVLNLGPKTIDFPGVNVFEVSDPEYATKEVLEEFRNMFIYVDTNLERVIASNAEKIGYNMAEVAYQRQNLINETLRNSTYSSLYYSLLGRYGSQILDLYFIHEPKYLAYDIINFAQEESYLESYLKLFYSYQDNISFHGHEDSATTTSTTITLGVLGTEYTAETSWIYSSDDDTWARSDGVKTLSTTNFKTKIVAYTGTPEDGDIINIVKGGFSLAWAMKLDDLTVQSTIFNKKDLNHLYFSVDIQQNYENYKIEGTSSEPKPVPALYNELVVTLYGVYGTFTIKYIFDETNKGLYKGQQVPYALSFNGNFTSPEFHFFVDGKEPEEYDAPSVDEEQSKKDARTESDLYGKVIYGELSAIANMPDYSKYCRLKNYYEDYNTGEKYEYQNALETSVLMALKKQVDKYDVAFLGSVFRSLGEVDS